MKIRVTTTIDIQPDEVENALAVVERIVEDLAQGACVPVLTDVVEAIADPLRHERPKEQVA